MLETGGRGGRRARRAVAAAVAAASAREAGSACWTRASGPGGQIWRHRPGQAPPEATQLLARLEAAPVEVLARASVFDAEERNGRWRLAVSREVRREIDGGGRWSWPAVPGSACCPFPAGPCRGCWGPGVARRCSRKGWTSRARPRGGGGHRPAAPAGGRLGPQGGRPAPGRCWSRPPGRGCSACCPSWPPGPPRLFRPCELGWRTWRTLPARLVGAGGARRGRGWRPCASPMASGRKWSRAAGSSAASVWCPTWRLGRLLGCAGTATRLWVGRGPAFLRDRRLRGRGGLRGGRGGRGLGGGGHRRAGGRRCLGLLPHGKPGA